MQPKAFSPTHGTEVHTVKQCPPLIIDAACSKVWAMSVA
jgi:hypothetical protein